MILELTLSFDGTSTTPPCEHAVNGQASACVWRIAGELEIGNTGGAFISWSTGAGLGGIFIAPGQTLREALDQAMAELDDPDTVFDDPGEEDMARVIVPVLHRACVEAGEEPGNFDRYDELEEPESYN